MAIACLGAGRLAEDAEYLLQPFDLTAGFLLVLDERGAFQILRLRGLGHFRQRLENFVFRRSKRP